MGLFAEACSLAHLILPKLSNENLFWIWYLTVDNAASLIKLSFLFLLCFTLFLFWNFFKTSSSSSSDSFWILFDFDCLLSIIVISDLSVNSIIFLYFELSSSFFIQIMVLFLN